MSGESSTKFCCDYAKRGTAGCKKCKNKCEKGALRIAKVVPNFFHDGEGKYIGLLISRKVHLLLNLKFVMNFPSHVYKVAYYVNILLSICCVPPITGEMKQWYHPKCLFETFERARAATKIIESSDEVDGFTTLTDEDKELIKSLIGDIAEKRANKGSKSATKKPAATAKKPATKSESKPASASKPAGAAKTTAVSPGKSSSSKVSV